MSNLGQLQESPLVQAAAIHGSKYQWGYKTNGEKGVDISQSDDQSNSRGNYWLGFPHLNLETHAGVIQLKQKMILSFQVAEFYFASMECSYS